MRWRYEEYEKKRKREKGGYNVPYIEVKNTASEYIGISNSVLVWFGCDDNSCYRIMLMCRVMVLNIYCISVYLTATTILAL